MERRIRLAKSLLSHDGVLIALIDDHEFYHLAILLDDIFPEYNRFTVVIEHNKRGRQGEDFAKTHEYAIFISPKGASAIGEEVVVGGVGGETRNLRRTGNNSFRKDRPGQFYPIWVDPVTERIVEIGKPLSLDQQRSEFKSTNLVAVFPIDKDGLERNWHYGPQRTLDEIKKGKVFARRQKYGIQIYYTLREKETKRFKTVWSRPSLDGSTHGTELLTKILGRPDAFPYPKSLYAVRDCISAVCQHRQNSLIVDFFAGSGTALNAVELLNSADGGRRRCILITNNEVSADENETLLNRSLLPGESAWESNGICRSVTWPRTRNVILGRRKDGTPLPGDYLTGRMVDREKRRTYRHAAFLSPDDLRVPAGLTLAERTKAEKDIHKRKLAFVAMIDGLPQNSVTPGSDFVVSEDQKAAVLFDPAALEAWLDALDGNDHVTDFFIVADSEAQFKSIKAQVDDLLGPLLVPEEEKRPMAAGFEANVAYFKLDFLEKDRVEVGAAFRENTAASVDEGRCCRPHARACRG